MLEHWVCFDCRKMFRKVSRWEGVRPGREPEFVYHLCPQCRKEMRLVGRYFAPPRRANEKGWAIMRLLADNGYTFQTEGSKSFVKRFIFGNVRPNLKIVRQGIAKYKKLSDGEELLRKIGQKPRA